ncbi:MAG TPA: hypothetical protein VHE81_00100 [Lacipirellulaceae bacterium]|nr:hypothetical protein [Lacipirellulaceae bacterium]
MQGDETMGSALARYVKDKSDTARHAIAQQIEPASACSASVAKKAVSVLSVAAVAGIVAAAIFYGPDFVRYLKIERM